MTKQARHCVVRFLLKVQVTLSRLLFEEMKIWKVLLVAFT